MSADLTVPPHIIKLMSDVRMAVTKQAIAPSAANVALCDAADAALYSAIASLQARLEAADRLLAEAAEFWSHYSSLNEGVQDDMAVERSDMLERMRAAHDAATQEKPAAPSEGSQG